jgi:dUTP pyrophosphatase
MSKDTILYKKNSKYGDLLVPAYPGDAGMDVVVSEDTVLTPGQVTRVNLGISIAVPSHLAFTFLTRSSSVARGLFVLPTLIDSGYRGPLYLFVLNTQHFNINLECGNRIAQVLLITNHAPVDIKLVNELPESHRGENGFGSSGGGL